MPTPISVRSYFPIFLILLYISCSSKSDTDQAILSATEATLTSSSLSIKNSSTAILMSMRERAADPISKGVAERLLPKMESISKYSAELISYIENLKKEGKLGIKESNELYDSIAGFKTHILNIDSSILKEFQRSMVLVTNGFDSGENGKDKFYSTFFKNASDAGSLTMLSNIQTNVSMAENKVLAYCHSRMTYHKPVF
ncbi:MAG TPA: hypothetical protein VMZ03_03240 [Chitinophagaceae bacterium]|nr:hypothetical protein [Chitinophagaceae bacterium]